MSRMHGGQVSQLRRDLFSHDALVLAKILAEPLAQADGTGKLLMSYIKRLTKYECRDAVDHLHRYARDNGYLSRTGSIWLRVLRTTGFFRCSIISVVKQPEIALYGGGICMLIQLVKFQLAYFSLQSCA